MYRIIYTSRATRPISDLELEELLEVARKKNKQKNLTGLFIVKGRIFFQCIEGEKENVEQVYEKILADDRHSDIIELFEEDCASRLFPNWTMGYQNLKTFDDIKSEKFKKISSVDELNLKKDEIVEIIEEFINFH